MYTEAKTKKTKLDHFETRAHEGGEASSQSAFPAHTSNLHVESPGGEFSRAAGGNLSPTESALGRVKERPETMQAVLCLALVVAGASSKGISTAGIHLHDCK